MDSVMLDILKVIKCQGGRVFGELRLNKIIFLLTHKYGIPIGIPFQEKKFGPYSRELKKTLEKLEREGLINIIKQGRLKVIELTEKGKKLAEKSQIEIPREIFFKKTETIKAEAYEVMNKLRKIKFIS